jgi:hypothetical protein
MKVEEGTHMDMKEEIPEPKSFPTIKDEQDEVSYFSVCLLRLVVTGIDHEPLVQAVSEVAPYQQLHYLLTHLSG